MVWTKHGRLPWGTTGAWSVSAWSLTQPLNRLWSGSAMYNSIMQPFHGQRTPTVLIQTPPKGQTQHWKLKLKSLFSQIVFLIYKEYVGFCDKSLKVSKYKTDTSVTVCIYTEADQNNPSCRCCTWFSTAVQFQVWQQLLQLQLQLIETDCRHPTYIFNIWRLPTGIPGDPKNKVF